MGSQAVFRASSGICFLALGDSTNKEDQLFCSRKHHNTCSPITTTTGFAGFRLNLLIGDCELNYKIKK